MKADIGSPLLLSIKIFMPSPLSILCIYIIYRCGRLNESADFKPNKNAKNQVQLIEHLKQVQKDNSRIAFWKRDKYKYQQEYRFLIHDFVDDHLSVDIGDISDITDLLKTEDLLNTYIEITFKVKSIE